jgi:large subunit ribosomal protein L31e
MAEEQKTRKIIIEREYIVPLREEWLKVPDYKRATKAAKALKQFIARHMKIYDRDLRKVKMDIYLNNELRFRGIKYPPAKIKVKAIKYEDGIVEVKLVDLPKHIVFELARKAKREAEIINKTSEKPEKKEEEKTEEKKEDIKEKEEASKIAEENIDKAQAKEMKHTSKTSQETPKIQRKALKR